MQDAKVENEKSLVRAPMGTESVQSINVEPEG